MNPIVLKKASIADLDTLQKIATQTFVETFAAVNTPENIANYLAENLSVQQLRKELEQTESHFYFAVLEEKIIGYLKINYGKAQTEILDEKALEIQRIYVLQEFHGKKVGQFFMDAVLEMAQISPVSFIWLGVWEENHRAVAFYKKNNFIVFDTHIFILGNEKQTDLLMKRAI